jgi:hypothetical protein
MDDDGTGELVDDGGWVDEVERAVLSESAEGRTIAAGFIATFGEFVSGTVRPILRDVAEAGGEPQLLVNGLAQMMRDVADTMEFPLGERPEPVSPAPGADGGPGSESDAPPAS